MQNKANSSAIHAIICHSALDAESNTFPKTWIPAFAGMTELKICPTEHEYAKQTQFLEVIGVHWRLKKQSQFKHLIRRQKKCNFASNLLFYSRLCAIFVRN
jgi:hypothetical protein